MEAGEATEERWKVSKIKCLTHWPSQAQKAATVCGAARTSTSQTKQRTCSRLFSPPGNSSYAALAPTRHSPAGEARQQEQQLLFLEILLHAKANNQAACVPWRVPATPLHVWHERQRVGALPIPSPALVPHTRSARTAIRPTPGAHLRGWSMRGSGAACCRFNPRRSRTKPSCPFVRLTRGVGPSRVQSQLVAVQPGDAAVLVGPNHLRKDRSGRFIAAALAHCSNLLPLPAASTTASALYSLQLLPNPSNEVPPAIKSHSQSTFEVSTSPLPVQSTTSMTCGRGCHKCKRIFLSQAVPASKAAAGVAAPPCCAHH